MDRVPFSWRRIPPSLWLILAAGIAVGVVSLIQGGCERGWWR